MKKILFVFLFFIPRFLFAQWNEVGVLLGASNYKGELSATLFNTYFIHPAGGAFFRHNFNRRWSYRFMGNYAYISGSDSKSILPYEQNRNLSFQSSIIDVSGFIEFNFFPYETGNKNFAWTPYMFTGFSVFRFNPQAVYNGQTYDLRPLGTEGENLPGGPGEYSNISYSILPVGGGIKVTVGRFGFALELCARKTATGYLDDVSNTYPDKKLLLQYGGPIAVALSDRSLPSPNPADSVNTIYPGKQRGNGTDDWYIIGGLTIYMRLGGRLKDPCKDSFVRKKY